MLIEIAHIITGAVISILVGVLGLCTIDYDKVQTFLRILIIAVAVYTAFFVLKLVWGLV